MSKIHAMNGVTYLHLKTGGIYEVVDVAIIEATLTLAVVYRSCADGRRWIRPYDEFCDGRFVYADRPKTSDTDPADRGN